MAIERMMINVNTQGLIKLGICAVLAWPLLIVFVAMHEVSHAIGYIATGYRVTGISVNPWTLIGWTAHDGGNSFIGLLFGPLLPLIVCAILVKSRHWLAWYSVLVFTIMGLSSLLWWPGDGGRLASILPHGAIIYVLLLIAYGIIIYIAVDKIAAEKHDKILTGGDTKSAK